MKKINQSSFAYNKSHYSLSVFISIIVLSSFMISSTNSFSSNDSNPVWTEIQDASALDIGANGSNVWFCSEENQIIRVNNDFVKRSLNLETTILDGGFPKCLRVEASVNQLVYVIDTEKNLYEFSLNYIEFYASRKVASEVVDVGCNQLGECFYANANNDVFLIKENENIKYFNTDSKIKSLDSGVNSLGKKFIVVVFESKDVVRVTVIEEPTKTSSAVIEKKFLDILATDVSIGVDNRIYISTTYFGTYVFNENSDLGKGQDFKLISSFGEYLSVGETVYVISKKKRIVKANLISK